MPHRQAHAILRVRVAIVPVQPELALVGIHVADNGVAFDRLISDVSGSVTPAGMRNVGHFTPDSRGAKMFDFDCQPNLQRYAPDFALGGNTKRTFYILAKTKVEKFEENQEV